MQAQYADRMIHRPFETECVVSANTDCDFLGIRRARAPRTGTLRRVGEFGRHLCFTATIKISQ